LTTSPPYLTKSLFKTGYECPAKLRYAKDRAYGNNQDDNTFLQVLAEGGFQVGELAKLMFPQGVEVSELAHDVAVTKTNQLLAQQNVTIFEAALREPSASEGAQTTAAPFFVRVDVLRKSGNTIDIIEVKSKSYDPEDEQFFKTSTGFSSKTLPYLLDVAFQSHVATLAFPGCLIRSFLLLPDKSKAATIDGLNQLFPITKVDAASRRVTCVPVAGVTAADLGEPLLALLDVTDLVTELLQQVREIPGFAGTVPQLAHQLAETLVNPRAVAAPVQAQCKSCEFRLPLDHHLRSGFHECWTEALKSNGLDVDRLHKGEPLVVDLWNGRRTKKWMAQGKRFMTDLAAEDLPLDVETSQLTRTHRQWMQISGEGLNDAGYFFDTTLFAQEMQTWDWPINLIDFETSRTALPFHRGGKPYGLVAFQWSHHVLHEDGRLEHVDDFLLSEPGQMPNIAFLKSLHKTLSRNQGTVMMWSSYENSVLNSLLDSLSNELKLSGIDSAEQAQVYEDLKVFVDSLTTRKQGNKLLHRGGRAMVDLCELSSKGFFHQRAGGSNSIKKVLPAMLSASQTLHDLYSQPAYGSVDLNAVTAQAFNSRNFDIPMVWWQLDDNADIIDPYQLLPGVFTDIDIHESSDDAVINQGGAAAAAYGRLQLENVTPTNRAAWRRALLKYCELDTLAMAMIVQGWRGWITSSDATTVTKPNETPAGPTS